VEVMIVSLAAIKNNPKISYFIDLYDHYVVHTNKSSSPEPDHFLITFKENEKLEERTILLASPNKKKISIVCRNECFLKKITFQKFFRIYFVFPHTILLSS